jgi:hypothetical protein
MPHPLGRCVDDLGRTNLERHGDANAAYRTHGKSGFRPIHRRLRTGYHDRHHHQSPGLRL